MRLLWLQASIVPFLGAGAPFSMQREPSVESLERRRNTFRRMAATKASLPNLGPDDKAERLVAPGEACSKKVKDRKGKKAKLKRGIEENEGVRQPETKVQRVAPEAILLRQTTCVPTSGSTRGSGTVPAAPAEPAAKKEPTPQRDEAEGDPQHVPFFFSGAPAKPPARPVWRERLEHLYQLCNPAKLAGLDKLLEKYRGQEAVLYAKVCKTYGLDPTKLHKPEADDGKGAAMSIPSIMGAISEVTSSTSCAGAGGVLADNARPPQPATKGAKGGGADSLSNSASSKAGTGDAGALFNATEVALADSSALAHASGVHMLQCSIAQSAGSVAADVAQVAAPGQQQQPVAKTQPCLETMPPMVAAAVVLYRSQLFRRFRPCNL